MKLGELYGKGKPIYSLEVFPPINGMPLDPIYDTIDNLLCYEPAFVSVTCGALGSARGGTIAIASEVKRRYGIEGVVHMTCAGKSMQDIENLMIDLSYLGLHNVVALRGDPPKGQKDFIPHADGHKYASDLVKQIMDMNHGKYQASGEKTMLPTRFGIATAAYPEGHLECPNKQKDLEHLKIKVDAGSDYLVTQMFLDADTYLWFADKAQAAGIEVPIIPGVMPIEKYAQIEFVIGQLGIGIPKDFKSKLDSRKDDADYIKKACEEHILSMCRKLIDGGAPGIQFFTMNKPDGTGKILKELTGR